MRGEFTLPFRTISPLFLTERRKGTQQKKGAMSLSLLLFLNLSVRGQWPQLRPSQEVRPLAVSEARQLRHYSATREGERTRQGCERRSVVPCVCIVLQSAIVMEVVTGKGLPGQLGVSFTVRYPLLSVLGLCGCFCPLVLRRSLCPLALQSVKQVGAHQGRCQGLQCGSLLQEFKGLTM